MINVAKPNLPPLDKYVELLKGIWDRNWLTNNGPLVNELELRLKEYLDVKHLLLLSNGTVAIQLALKALGLTTGEVITTPFSFVATTSSIVWEGLTPVFADIDPHTLNISPAAIESKITADTVAILATHVYGNPCDIEAIEQIARKHQLKVIYDAAHCFGSKYNNRSVFDYGDISTTSFHATKVFHTIEGGAVFTQSAELLKTLAYMRNFGYDGPEDFACVGINAKNSEFHAAMGLLILDQADANLEERIKISERYDQKLKGLNVQHVRIQSGATFNYAYYPVIFQDEAALLKAVKMLNDNWIYPRRYFYPSLSKLRYVQPHECPVSEDISRRVLCLPLYTGIKDVEVDLICRLLLRAQNN
ncbi:DegT/DnrJ/EryC1/StrS family aminotransferase [Chitinophaga flava]|uniref:Aminotransferase DegT n=1 Tax=Chitinophaga flava TaxID=2259036 RepID=A0A365XTM8_9BACT|nr:DegT/DnrJ/EryC1/StrS family aminotransferase [Chitinophaga flava]RBL89054.1 aminotransferase DegT [Chitinophaga flava]